MAFSKMELRMIDRTVGGLCRRRSPVQFKDQLRFVYKTEGHSVFVFEERPYWRNPSEWIRMGVARFRFTRSRDTWTLYWMRHNGKWHAYDPETRKGDLSTLVKIMDEDKYGAFFG